jgi:hypothetical protein
MATFSRQSKASSGTTLTFNNATAAGGDIVTNGDGRTELVLRNTHTATQNVVISGNSRQRSADAQFPALTVPDITIVVPANGGIVHVGPFPAAYTDNNGNLNLSYSANSGGNTLTVACVA